MLLQPLADHRRLAVEVDIALAQPGRLSAAQVPQRDQVVGDPRSRAGTARSGRRSRPRRQAVPRCVATARPGQATSTPWPGVGERAALRHYNITNRQACPERPHIDTAQPVARASGDPTATAGRNSKRRSWSSVGRTAPCRGNGTAEGSPYAVASTVSGRAVPSMMLASRPGHHWLVGLGHLRSLASRVRR